MSRHRTEDEFGEALDTADGADEPWAPKRVSPEPEMALPPQVRGVLYDRLYIAKEGLTSRAIYSIMRLAAFANPEFYREQAMRLSTFGKPRLFAARKSCLGTSRCPGAVFRQFGCYC